MNGGGSRMFGRNEFGVGKDEVGGSRNSEGEVAVAAAAEVGGDSHGIGVELLVKKFQGGMVRLFGVGGKRSEFRMGKLVGDRINHDGCRWK